MQVTCPCCNHVIILAQPSSTPQFVNYVSAPIMPSFEAMIVADVMGDVIANVIVDDIF